MTCSRCGRQMFDMSKHKCARMGSMSKEELIALDKLLVKLQQYLDVKYAMSPGFETTYRLRRIVDLEIGRLEAAKEPKA
jgi:hypothetical protein